MHLRSTNPAALVYKLPQSLHNRMSRTVTTLIVRAHMLVASYWQRACCVPLEPYTLGVMQVVTTNRCCACTIVKHVAGHWDKEGITIAYKIGACRKVFDHVKINQSNSRNTAIATNSYIPEESQSDAYYNSAV